LKTRNWERATKLAREIEEGKKPRVTIAEATDAFVRDAEARGLRPASVYKYRLLFKQLKAFSEKEGLELLSECDVETLRRFRESWINKNYSARKKLEALRTFFRFAHESSWTDSNPALLIKPTKVDDPPTLPYTQAEFRSVIEACGKYPRPEHPNERRGARLKALVLLLRYSGLRITDAVTLSKHQIEDGVLKLRTAKTGTDVRVPLPPRAVDALDALPTTGGYYFWSGHGTKKSCVGDYQRSFKKLYKLAGVENGHENARLLDDLNMEAGGVEPPSEKPCNTKPTCLSRSVGFAASAQNRQDAPVTSPMISPPHCGPKRDSQPTV
jgi:integrase/recombinase XerD